MTTERRMAVALRAILARFFSAEEIYDLLWELDLEDTVSKHASRDNLATQAADTLARHGKLEEAIRLAHNKRPNIPPYLWPPTEEAEPTATKEGPLTLSLSQKRGLAAAIQRLGIEDIDGRLLLLWQLGIDENVLAVDGSGQDFALRLARYLEQHPELLALLETLGQGPTT